VCFSPSVHSRNCIGINIVYLFVAPRNGDLRIARGSLTNSSFTSGRLEIFINGEWGTVCIDEFSFTDATVACRQLGYSGAISGPIEASDNPL